MAKKSNQGSFNPWRNGVTKGGHRPQEASSALQKSIRRGETYDALYWASDLDLSGFPKYVWKRLKIMVSEDIGLANPTLPAQIWALYQMWLDYTKNENGHPAQAQLFLSHAVLLMAESAKSRTVDNARITFWEDHDGQHREIPEYALDMHTARGKQRVGDYGFECFVEEGSILNDEISGGIHDDLKEKAEKHLRRLGEKHRESKGVNVNKEMDQRKDGPPFSDVGEEPQVEKRPQPDLFGSLGEEVDF